MKSALAEVKTVTSFAKINSNNVNLYLTSYQKEGEVYDLERKLWKLKISDLDIPCFIIPIKPIWAKELFDYGISNETLFGSDVNLTANRENVYYRSSSLSKILKGKSRVLWYVSEQKNFETTHKMLRACSYIDEVLVDQPKKLFKKFQKLGVYEWKDIYKIADYAIENKIMAFRFSDTEVFQKPLSFKKLKEIYKLHTGKNLMLIQPVQITYDLFIKLYKLCN